ncbi:uncharacterized protein LOC112495402 [Cephus cinctus]|uniref:peptidylprolyl isomerase n=1 Tax=Cephus cinctus TaxID=211228 RepID=A0AAJ7W7U5_CEPCN|nr:uncharacterized protein LOC112495402 [Cephus cinctus]
MAKKHVTEEQTLQTATKAVITIAYDFALKQKPNLMPTNQPEVNVEKSTIKECEIMFVFDLPAEITIGKYRGIDIVKPVATVNQEEIDTQIKLLQDSFAIFNPKEKGKLEKDDTAVFNFTGFLDGKKFPGGEAKNMELEIGSGKFIPGFEEGMIGMEPKSKKTIEVTFPEDYHVPNLKGQLVQFEIELNEIKTKVINEDLEELVKDVNIPDVTTTEQLLENIKKQIEVQKTMTIKEQFMEELIAKIVKDSKIIIPSFAVKNETELLVTRGSFVFPTVEIELEVGRHKSVAAINESVAKFNSEIILVSQKDPKVDNPQLSEVYNHGDAETLVSPNVSKSLEEELIQRIVNNLQQILDVHGSIPQGVISQITDGMKANLLLKDVGGQKQVGAIEKDLTAKIKDRIDEQQREYYLRERLRAIKEELGEIDGKSNEMKRYLERLETEEFPEAIKTRVKEEISRYEDMPQASSESNIIRTYID